MNKNSECLFSLCIFTSHTIPYSAWWLLQYQIYNHFWVEFAHENRFERGMLVFNTHETLKVVHIRLIQRKT